MGGGGGVWCGGVVGCGGGVFGAVVGLVGVGVVGVWWGAVVEPGVWGGRVVVFGGVACGWAEVRLQSFRATYKVE